MTTSIKTCFKCGAEKPLTEFYKHPQMGDGHLNKCKTCTKADVHAYRHESPNRAKVLEYDRRRGSRQGLDYLREYRSKNPAKYKAHKALGNAVRDGRITKPDSCSHCHMQARLEGHHEDYKKPLDVVWLCPACHKSLHAFYRTVGRKIRA